ncbi:MAG: hypothetical protein ACRDOD_17800, partial [Streptosporangiaceae bacterium]
TETDQYGFPAPVHADTELQLGLVDPATLTIVPGSLKIVLQDATPTAYHYAEVHGLTPGTFYAYVALSGGQQAQPSSMQFPVGAGGSLDYPGTFTTPSTPPGRYLFTLALSNDLHMGEGESGIIENGWPPAFEQDPGLPPYPVVMLSAMLGDLRQPDRAVDRLLVAGDLTSGPALSDATNVKQMLDGWGKIEQDYFVARGNHDRSRPAALTIRARRCRTPHRSTTTAGAMSFRTRSRRCRPIRSAGCASSGWTPRCWTRPAGR